MTTLPLRPDRTSHRRSGAGLLASRALLLLGVLAILFMPAQAFGQSQSGSSGIHVSAQQVMATLLDNEDTDGDRKITVHDPFVKGTDRGDKAFWFTSLDGTRYEVAGTYYLSNLLQELTLLHESGHDTGWVRAEHIFESPADRISRAIRELYWNGLTRTVDEGGLPRLLADEKISNANGVHYVYVPSSDDLARKYYASVSARHPGWNLQVRTVPAQRDSAFFRGLEGKHGILSLQLVKTRDGTARGVPFVVPGGRFNEMYGWDSYFIVLGLLQDNRVDLARGIVDNLVYEINHYGAILNANRSYYLTRSQPPFLTSAARACYAHLPKNSARREWLRGVLDAAIREYHQVWMNKDRLLGIGLSRYYDEGSRVPPEVEPGHYDVVFRSYAQQRGMDIREFEEAYRDGTIVVPDLDDFFKHDRAMRESGHDTSNRLVGRCANLATVDLNSLLYRTETDIATCIRTFFGDTLRVQSGEVVRSGEWFKRAQRRKELMNRYLWNADRGMFFDYDVKSRSQTGYISATTFWPMWAGLASQEQAAKIVANALPELEQAGGLAATAKGSRGPVTPERPQRQWDYPFGWAPHQILAWQGLLNYDFAGTAQRLVYKWMYMITVNAVQYNGTVPEKFDLVGRTHEVYAEYGNVGTRFDYITREGFGWTNASFQCGLSLLRPSLRDSLNRLIPPEVAF
jgi:alpha,alpha-trehalase